MGKMMPEKMGATQIENGKTRHSRDNIFVVLQICDFSGEDIYHFQVRGRLGL